MVNLLPLPSGPFRSQTAWERGWTRRCLQRAVDEGRLRHVVRDVYLDSTLEDSQELRLACLRLVLPPHGVAVDRTAAWLWDVEVSSAPTEEVPDLEFFVLRGHSRIERAGVASGERDLSPDDVVELDGVLVANPPRTALDLACRSGRYDAIATLDAFARVRGVIQSDLTSLLPRFRGRRGVVQARELVPLMDARAESSGESLTRIVILDAGLPCPVPQHWVVMGGVAVYRLDLAYPRYKIAVEYDGYDYHSDPERRKADKERRKWLRAHGWIVIVVRKDDFGDDARRVWVRELRDALVARRHWGRLART
jgi:hypothetical protein